MPAGPHGEYELPFTVPAGRAGRFTEEIKAGRLDAVKSGKAIPGGDITIRRGNNNMIVDSAGIMNLSPPSGKGCSRYVSELSGMVRCCSPDKHGPAE